MERDTAEGPYENDTLRLEESELDGLEDEVGPNPHGDIMESFDKVVIELESGRELEFTGLNASSIKLIVNGDGLNDTCLECGYEADPYESLNKVRGGPEDRAVYYCDGCYEESPVRQLV